MNDLLLPFLEHWSYIGLFLVLLSCGFGLPLPEDVPLLISGWLVHRGHAELTTMIAVGIAGVLAGDLTLHLLGRRYGESIVDMAWIRRFVTSSHLEWAEQKFQRRGPIIVFAARFMPGARAVIFLTSGIFRMPIWKFVAIDGFAAMISIPFWIWLGARFGLEAERIVGNVKDAGYVVFGVLAIVLLVWTVWEWRQIRRRRRQEIARQLAQPARVSDQRPVEHDPSPRPPSPPAKAKKPVAEVVAAASDSGGDLP